MRKAYASYFAAYLLAHVPDSNPISKIILFGSVAKDEATRSSDMDIFIELKNEGKKWARQLEQITEAFYHSREALLFKAKGIEHKINLVIGKLNDWKDLKKSIESTGIILFGRYSSSGTGGKKFALIFWKGIGRNRGAFLNKLHGFKVGDKRYAGLLEKIGGKKVGKSSIMIPIEYTDEIMKILRHYRVNAQVLEIYSS